MAAFTVTGGLTVSAAVVAEARDAAGGEAAEVAARVPVLVFILAIVGGIVVEVGE